jgi:hypothetical protein
MLFFLNTLKCYGVKKCVKYFEVLNTLNALKKKKIK